jgi:hypothetical protein
VEIACKEFVKILQEAEQRGTVINISGVAAKITQLPPGVGILAVFDKCKEKGWVGGSAWAPWLTAEGKKAAMT